MPWFLNGHLVDLLDRGFREIVASFPITTFLDPFEVAVHDAHTSLADSILNDGFGSDMQHPSPAAIVLNLLPPFSAGLPLKRLGLELPLPGLVVQGALALPLASLLRKAFKRALKLGGAFILLFLVGRYLIRPRAGPTWIDFLNVVKYPPSITFNLMTIGVNLTVMGLAAQASEELQRFFQPLVVFGQVPLFFYLTHLFLYAGLGLWLTPHGTSIPKMYPYWLLGLLILYPLCQWYGQLKYRQPANSILRFF